MIRTFETHKIRKTAELSSALWNFHTIGTQGEEAVIQAPVPGCWENYPDTVSYRGQASYSREFEAKGNIRLEFKGVSHTASVLVDGKPVGSHYNAYTPFDVVLKDIRPGIHQLEVIADNSFGPDSALHVPNDYQSYGGISRGVVLEELGEAYLSWIHFTPFLRKDGWYGKAEICVRNLSSGRLDGSVEVEIGKNSFAVLPIVLEGEEEKSFSTQEQPCPWAECWSPESPVLYLITAVLRTADGAADDIIDRVGFREIRTEGKDILLNGRKLRIKGFCRHEDHPQFGCALPFSAMQHDLMLIKDLGANSIRTVHYPNDELFLDLCDEQGILIWEENHARGLSEENMRNPHFKQQCGDCIREMITAHYNHPSIYIWGILNECASDTEYGRECYSEQYELIKSLDPYRPRSSASCRFKTDICLGYPEVVSYNIYPKWYHDVPVEDYLDELYQWIQNESEGTGKPFLITEIGAGAIYGYRTPAHVKWSEEYQVQALKEQLQAVFSREGCSGVYIWQFCDVRVCDSWFGSRPRTMNNKGIVDEYRRPKLAYEVVKDSYRSLGNYF